MYCQLKGYPCTCQQATLVVPGGYLKESTCLSSTQVPVGYRYPISYPIRYAVMAALIRSNSN